MIDNRTVGRTIAALRQMRGLTQQQLAAALNVSHQAVSKWENGAALPDIQTMVELTQLFGITVEQLLNGNISEAGFSEEDKAENPFRSIGDFFNGVIDDIGSCFRQSEGDRVETELVDEDEKKDEPSVDLQKILQMAPFMSKGAVEDMLRKCGKKLSAQEIAKFAPFVDSAFLEEMIRDSECEISWDTLRKVAPFLKREMVDAFARTIALGEKYVRPASSDAGRATGEVCRVFDEVSRKIGAGVDRAARKMTKFGEEVVNEVTKAIDNLAASDSMMNRDAKIARTRTAAFERALDDNRWDWIEAHIGEIKDDSLKMRIAGRAQELDMHDWLNRVFGFEDEAEIEIAVMDKDWDWLSKRIGKFDKETCRRIAMTAADDGSWSWLSEKMEELDVPEQIPELVEMARRSDGRAFAIEMMREKMLPEQREQAAIAAIEDGDLEFAGLALELLPIDSTMLCCRFAAKSGKWDAVIHFSERLDCDDITTLMEIAIEDGDFDGIDLMDELLKTKLIAEAE